MHAILVLIISLIALLWAANHLITGTATLATRFDISPLVLGMTVVAFGTSAPELVLSVISSIQDKNNVTLVNAIGSNIANIGLVLGIAILIKPQALNYERVKKAYPILIITMLFSYSLILDGFLGKIDGCLFLIACIALISYCIYKASQHAKHDQFLTNFKTAISSNRSLNATLGSIFLGLLILPISSRYCVDSATEIARWLGVGELTIGLTIVAIGTTLPELVTALIAIAKEEEDIAVGTILGSNCYNLLLILIFPALLSPAKVSNIILWRDMPVMIALTFLLIFLNYYYKKQLSRWHGGILLLIYFSYITSLIIKAKGY